MAYEVNTGGSGGAKKKPNTWEELIQGYSDRSGNEGYYDEFGYHQAPAPWITEQPQPQPEPIEPEQPEETTPAQTTAEKKKEEEPIVEPVTEEKKQEEETPVVQPTRSGSFVDEDTEARRNVPPEETASQLFQDWTNLVERNEPDDEGWFYQQEPERGGNLVTPVGYTGTDSNSGTSNSYYGTNGRTEGETSYVTATPQPAYSDADIDGAIQFMRNELGIMEYDPVYERDYAEQLLADNAVPEAYLPAQVQEQTPPTEPTPAPQRLNPSISEFDLLMEQPVTAQPEMLFPTDYGGNTIPEMPTVSTPVVVGQTRAPGIGTGAGVGPIAQDPSYLGLNTILDNMPKYGPDPIGAVLGLGAKPATAEATYNPQTGQVVYDNFGDMVLGNLGLRTGGRQDNYDTFGEMLLGQADLQPLREGELSPTPYSTSGTATQATQRAPEPAPISGNPLREAIDRVNAGDLRTTDITRGRPVDNTTETPVDITDVDPTRRFQGGNPQTPYDPFANMSTYDTFTPPEDQMLFPTDYGSTHPFTGDSNPVGAELAGNIGYFVDSNSGRGGDVARENAIDEMIFANGGDPYDPRLRDTFGKLIDQINNDDKIEPYVERPFSGDRTVEDYVQDVEDFFGNIPDVTGDALNDLVEDVREDYRLRNEADAKADELGIYPGDPRYDRFIYDYINGKQEEARKAELPWWSPEAREGRRDELQKQIEEARREFATDQFSPNQAWRIEDYVQNPDRYTVDENGNLRLDNQAQSGRYTTEQLLANPALYGNVWQDAVGTDRLMDDLMQMNAPGILSDGSLNTAAQAMFLGMNTDGTLSSPQYGTQEGQSVLSPEQILHLFDRGGSFANPESGLLMDPAFANLIASDSVHSRQNPELAQTLYLTEDQYAQMVDAFIKGNPLIRAAYDSGLLTMDDIANNFFKNVVITQGRGSGSGYGSGYRGYGGGGGGGSYGSGYGYNSPTAKKQEEQRINNIMKNWAF